MIMILGLLESPESVAFARHSRGILSGGDRPVKAATPKDGSHRILLGVSGFSKPEVFYNDSIMFFICIL